MTQRRKTAKPRAASRVHHEIAFSYRIDFETTARLDPESEGEGVTVVRGRIIHAVDGENETVAGKLYGYCVRQERVQALGNLFDVCDEDPQLGGAVSSVWDYDTQTYREELDLEPPSNGDLIIPWAMTLLPGHRGKGIGLRALWRFMDYFGSGATIAVLKPYPLNHEANDIKDADYLKMQYDQFAKVSMKDGQAKLAEHWSRLGFKRVPDSDYFYLDMQCKRPSLEDLIQKERWKPRDRTRQK